MFKKIFLFLFFFFLFNFKVNALTETPSNAYSISSTSFERCRINSSSSGNNDTSFLTECTTFTPNYNSFSSFGKPTQFPYVFNRYKIRFNLINAVSFNDLDTYTVNYFLNTKNIPNSYFLNPKISVSGGVSSYCDNCGKINVLESKTEPSTNGGYFVTITFQTMISNLKYITIHYDSPIANNNSFLTLDERLNYGIHTEFQFGISNFSMAYEKSSNSLLNQQINQNQTIINQNNQTNQNLKDINDTLNDDTPPNSDISGLGNVTGLLPAGPVDSLLNIPTQFLSIAVSSMGGQCKPLSGNWVYNQSLTFPCFNEIIWDDFENETLLNFLELIPCAFILIIYFKHLYKKVERATSMNTNSDDEWGVI